MLITKELYTHFHSKPKDNVIRNTHCFCMIVDSETAQWSNNDEQFTVEFKRKANQLTGHYYDWDYEQEEWVNTDIMADDDLLERLKRHEFKLFAL